jgi:hypothetical protein
MRFERKAANRESWWQPQTDEAQFYPDWDTRLNTICFRASRQRARNLDGKYDYRIVMTLDEAASLISELAESALRNAPDALEVALASKSNDLVRLLACANGLKPTLPLPETLDDYASSRNEAWEEPGKAP